MSQIPKYINSFNTQELNMGGQVECKRTDRPFIVCSSTKTGPHTLLTKYIQHLADSVRKQTTYIQHLADFVGNPAKHIQHLRDFVKKQNLSVHSNNPVKIK